MLVANLVVQVVGIVSLVDYMVWVYPSSMPCLRYALSVRLDLFGKFSCIYANVNVGGDIQGLLGEL